MLDENNNEVTFEELRGEDDHESEFKPEMVATEENLSVYESAEELENEEVAEAAAGFDNEEEQEGVYGKENI